VNLPIRYTRQKDPLFSQYSAALGLCSNEMVDEAISYAELHFQVSESAQFTMCFQSVYKKSESLAAQRRDSTLRKNRKCVRKIQA
jgi:hypothetical protein